MGRFERLAVRRVQRGHQERRELSRRDGGDGSGARHHRQSQQGTRRATAGAAIEELLRFREVATAHKDLVESAGSLNEIMLALSNIGGLNVETMADLQAQGSDTFKQLVDAGFTEQQSLQQMKGFLEQTRQAHKELGLPIDENTQKLIAQAEEQGVLKKEQISTNDIMMQGLSAIIKALGGDIPEAFTKMTKAGVETATKVGGALNESVNGALEDGNQKIKDANWAGYASKAAAAGSVSKGAVDKVTGAVKGVDKQLDGTDWDGWAREAEAAAKVAEDAVNGVSMGHSPGGIKEIPLKLFEAMRAFKQWERQGVISAEAVERAVYGVGDTAGSVGQMNAAIEHGEVQVKYASDRKQEGLADIVRAIGEQLEEAATTEKPVNVAITTIDSMSMEQAVESKILPAIEKAIRNNRRQTRSNLRQVLGVRGVGE